MWIVLVVEEKWRNERGSINLLFCFDFLVFLSKNGLFFLNISLGKKVSEEFFCCNNNTGKEGRGGKFMSKQ